MIFYSDLTTNSLQMMPEQQQRYIPEVDATDYINPHVRAKLL